MEWQLVQKGLDAAKKAGIRPPRIKPVRNQEWMINQLEGSGITMIGRYRGLVTGMEFQSEKGHVFKESPGVVANRKSCLRIPRKSITDSMVIAISRTAAKRPPVPRQIDQPIRGPTVREGGRYSGASA